MTSTKTRRMENLEKDLESFYGILKGLIDVQGLLDSSEIRDAPNSLIPRQGVYFFLDRDEAGLLGVPRVVRIGTHGVSTGSKSTLKQRLIEHIGTSDGYGNHRSSIFRQYVGWSFIRKNNLVEEFNEWNNPKVDKEVLAKEKAIEQQVSAYIGNLNLLVLNVPGSASSENDRSYIEKNTIALLSYVGNVLLPPSKNWLGFWVGNDKINKSGLWNVDYTFSMYDHNLIDFISSYADLTTGKQNYGELPASFRKKNADRSNMSFKHPFSQHKLSDFLTNQGDDLS